MRQSSKTLSQEQNTFWNSRGSRNGMEKSRGLIFDIKRFAVHDGPGIRTTVFMKGCPLRCMWCQNPESIDKETELMFFKNRCVLCGECVKVCPKGVHRIGNKGERIIKREFCIKCGKCIEICPTQALERVGKWVTVDEILEEVQRDRAFYEMSGGGVTISGGEPTFQNEFVKNLLKECKNIGLHTCLDTSGYCKWKRLESLLKYVDLLLYDIKHMDASLHKTFTGVSNKLILENLRKVVAKGKKEINIRMPLIPGYNDSIDNIKNTVKYIVQLGIKEIEILPYHRLGIAKYEQLGLEYSLKNIYPPSNGYMKKMKEIIQSLGSKVIIA